MDHFKKFQDLKDRAENERKELHNKMVEYWKTRGPFKDVYDIPRLPVVDKEEWNNFFIPRLIELGAIPKKDLIDGVVYEGDHRRTKRARWNSEKNRFEYVRDKFGGKHIDKCNHFEDDDGYALFVPINICDDQTFEEIK